MSAENAPLCDLNAIYDYSTPSVWEKERTPLSFLGRVDKAAVARKDVCFDDF